MRRGVAAVLALLCGLGLAASARAQGMYYKEVAKDGRIYVFNVEANALAFEKSGEVGKGLTRIGAGPNGETVVADSEEALELFFFKHGISQTVEKPKKPKATISWKDGQTTVEFDKAQITFMNRLQLRYTHEFPDDAVQLPGTANKGDSKGSFRIRRYEPQFQGWIYTKDLTFKLEFAFQDFQNAAVAAGGGINDAYFNYDFTHGKKLFRLQMGQFKVPFGRQELTTSFALQFVDRSIVAGEYERGRDQGIQIDGATSGSKFTYALGLFNGQGRSFTLNDNNKFQFDARIQFQPFGDVRYSEADFESKDKPLIAFAAQYDQNDFANTVAAPIPPVTSCPCGIGAFKRQIYGGDFVFKYKGVFVMAEYFHRKIDPALAGAPNFDSNGYNLEAGYLIGGPDKGKWEVVARYASLDPTNAAGGNDRTETGFGLNWFYNKHFAKIQSDYRLLKNKANDQTNKEFRIQTQLYF
jgi:hypothetical protein